MNKQTKALKIINVILHILLGIFLVICFPFAMIKCAYNLALGIIEKFIMDY